MDEPERMLNQTGSSLERALLQEGRSYPIPAALRAHTLAALGLAGSAGLATGGALAWLMAKTWTTKLLLAMSALTLLVAIPVSYVTLRKGGTPVPAPAPLPAVVMPSARAPSSPVAPPREAPAPVTVPLVAAPSVATLSTGRAAAASATSALRAEVAALDAVRSTLASGNAAGALSFLEAYFRTFPRGRLRLEAEVLRIDSLAKGGQTGDAKRYAQEFLKRHPNSVLAGRVQTYAER